MATGCKYPHPVPVIGDTARESVQKKDVVYVFSQLYAFGELPSQMWRLRNLFHDRNRYDITIVTYPLEKLRVNRSLFNIAMRGVNVVHSTDDDLIWFDSDELGDAAIIEDGNRIYVMCNSGQLRTWFLMAYQNRQPDYYFSLTGQERERGEMLRRHFNIPGGAPIVTLHVREPGFKNSHGVPEGPDSTLRNVRIETYLPAIEFLIKEGYYVVRLGDTTMKPLSGLPKQFIDAPFHSKCNDMVEPYFISVSDFFLCTASGPLTIADAFGTPRLITNWPLARYAWAWQDDLYLFKRYYSRELQRNLTYEEVLCSPLMFLYDIESIHRAGLEVVDNSAEEILAAVHEMMSRLKGTYSTSHEMSAINSQFRMIQKRAFGFHQQRDPDLPYVSLLHFFDHKNVPISMEYLKRNPDLLGFGSSREPSPGEPR